MRALIVDDSKVMRLIVGKIVKANGFETVEAGDGQEGLTQLRGGSGAFQQARVDWNMPVMDGLTFVRAVRADPTFSGMRLIMVTTESDIGRVTEAIEAGADEYLMKPFTKESLGDKLAILGFESASC